MSDLTFWGVKELLKPADVWFSVIFFLYTFPSISVDSDKPSVFCDLLIGRAGLRRSFPPGLDEALPYQIIPTTAMIIPRTTCRLRPSFPKKRNPKIRTRIVFMCPITWKDTAVNLPIQMNWLRLVPTAIVHDRMMNICREQSGANHQQHS